MATDNKTGENIYYCDIQPQDASLFYKIEWTLTTKLSKYLLVRQSEFIKYDSKEWFRSLTALREQNLIDIGENKIGYTVS